MLGLRAVPLCRWSLLLYCSVFCGLASLPAQEQPASVESALSRYEFRSVHDPNGTGKFFMGREIALVMGHQGSDWLERPERAREERPDLLIPALQVKAGNIVADIGAGTGYYTWRMAECVGTNGLVYAVDIQVEMLNLLKRQMAERRITNVKGVLGDISDPKLPASSVDLVLMVDVYHELSHPFEMMQSICGALKPGGRVALVEFRAEDSKVPIKAVHKMSEAQVRKEMAIHPLKWTETLSMLPWQHIIIFTRTP